MSHPETGVTVRSLTALLSSSLTNRNLGNIQNVQVHVIAGVYRLWKCTGGDLDDLGIASIEEEYNGGREFWFERVHLTDTRCQFQETGANSVEMSLTSGSLPYDPHVRKGSRYILGIFFFFPSGSHPRHPSIPFYTLFKRPVSRTLKITAQRL